MAEQQGYRAGFAGDSTPMRAGLGSTLRASTTSRARKRKNSSTPVLSPRNAATLCTRIMHQKRAGDSEIYV
jgi:hypothetical protein